MIKTRRNEIDNFECKIVSEIELLLVECFKNETIVTNHEAMKSPMIQ